jgi:hypothetical protein
MMTNESGHLLNQEAEVSGATVIAYRTPGSKGPYPRIVPAPADRAWMEVETQRWANRCLPLRIANANGWFILNPAPVEIRWNGTRALDALTIRGLEDGVGLGRSMFGFGIVTFVIPYLFRTPRGVNLLVRGPANQPKDGVFPLDGLVETDWLPFSFTMNWKVTRPGMKIRFERDEPLAMLVPMERGGVERYEPEIRNLDSNPVLAAKYEAWLRSRVDAAKVAKESQYAVLARQGHYIRGEDHSGDRPDQHQAKLTVRAFAENEPPPPIEPVTESAAQPGTGGGGWWQRLWRR